MENKVNGDDGYYTGNDLLDSNEKILFQKINEAIKQQKTVIANIFSLKEKNDEKLQKYRKEIEELKVQQAPESKINTLERVRSTINHTQSLIIQILQPTFNQLFDEIAGDFALGGLGYNEKLRTSTWLNFILGYRKIEHRIDGSRDQYRYEFAARTREEKNEKKIQEKAEKIKKNKEKVQLPLDHLLLNQQTYPELKQTMLIKIDSIVSDYQQKILKDTKDPTQLKCLIDNYFLFIFLQMLIQSKVVFDTKKPRSNPFFVQVLDDCLLHIQEKYGIILTISSDDIKKKFFSKIDETTQPLELIYKNCTESDLLEWERYLNTYFFVPKKTSVDHLRRRIMSDRISSMQRMENYREMLNPLYHGAKEQRDKILKTIEILEKHQANDNMISNILQQIKENLVKSEEDMKNSVVFEEEPIITKNPESIIKIQQQYLKWYQIPVQYRKIFGVVINRLNHFHQVKAHLTKKANKNNEKILDQLIDSDQKIEDILHYLNKLITTNYVSTHFHQKWTKKQQEKYQIIQSLCNGTQKIQNIIKPKEVITGQIALEF